MDTDKRLEAVQRFTEARNKWLSMQAGPRVVERLAAFRELDAAAGELRSIERAKGAGQ